MTLKIIGKMWECNNQCKSDCCSEIFLPLPPAYKESLEKSGFYIVNNNYTDFSWLSYHKAIIVEKLNNGSRKIMLSPDVKYEILFNPFKGYDELHVFDKCDKLLSSHRCKIFRARPEICRKAKCIVFDDSPEIKWYGENGLLKGVK